MVKPECLLGLDVARLRAFLTHLDVISNSLTFGQGLEAGTLDGGEVYEYVCAAIGGRNEAEALGLVKPFNGTGSHVNVLYQ